jgi:hypothetical protein
MYLSKFSFGAVSSELMKESGYEYSFFLNEKYDSAIMGVDYVTESVIYSLRRLIYIEMEEMENDGLLDDFMDRQQLLKFAYVYWWDLFLDIHEFEVNFPPTLLQDIEREYKMVA